MVLYLNKTLRLFSTKLWEHVIVDELNKVELVSNKTWDFSKL